MSILHLGNFFLYLSYVWVILPLYFRYIHNCINMFVNVIYMFLVICWCTSYYLLLVVTPSWESCHAYFLYIIFYSVVAILVDLFSQKRINIPLFELVVTCIETHILVTNFSISHKFPSVIICFFCFLLLGHIFPLNIQQSKICIQHNLYTIFDKMSIVSCCVFSHTRIQCMTLTTREFFYLPSVNSRGCIYWYRFQR